MGCARLLSKLVLGALVVAMPIAVFIAAPFAAAWNLREAVTGADTLYLQQKVHWPTVRETMRESMLRSALDVPTTIAADAEVAAEPPRGIVARIKDRIKRYAGRRVVDKMVDDFITAEGLPKLYNARRTMSRTLGRATDDEATMTQRFKGVWSRVTRAEFRSLTEFEIEMQDQFSADRSYHAVLELRGIEWILTELRFRSANEVTPVASAR